MTDPVLTVDEMRAAEQALIDAGTDVHQLMQIAGRGAAEWVWRVSAGRSVTILCGPGNNGGDGYVIAETLRARGLAVQVVAPLNTATQAAKQARSMYAGDVMTSAACVSGDVFVDCLFGSGLSRALPVELAEPLDALAANHHYRVAIDLPSGIDSDRGDLMGPEIEYDLTIALGAWKRAHFLMPAASRMGALRLVDIGVDTANWGTHRIERPSLSLPAADAHKYRRGLLAIVGGMMPGAALLSAHSAMHSGAGYVKLLSDHSHPAAPADLVVESGSLPDALSDNRVNAILVGPGLGRDETAQMRLGVALDHDVPCIVDADGLAILRPGMLGKRSRNLIVTPHEGELAALEGAFGLAGKGGKVERATALAAATGAVVVAKGPDTLVASSAGQIAFAGRASSWLSTAGTGDVLAGIAVSRLAAGTAPFAAACEAVWLHAEAARQAGPAFTAMELAQCVKGAYAACL